MRKFLFQIINALLFGSDPLVSNIGDMLKHRAEARQKRKQRDKLMAKAAQKELLMTDAATGYKQAKLLINKDLEQLF